MPQRTAYHDTYRVKGAGVRNGESLSRTLRDLNYFLILVSCFCIVFLSRGPYGGFNQLCELMETPASD